MVSELQLADAEINQQVIHLASAAGRIAVGLNPELDYGAHNKEEQGIENRDYQIETWAAIDQARKDGKSSALVHLATGLGKTTVGVVDALRYAGEFVEKNGRAPKILFAVHKNEIIDQAAERFQKFAPDLKHGRYAEGKKDFSAPVTFATMQSLYRNLDSFDKDEFDYIIYDEAHHMQAETFNAVVAHFEPDFQLALTGTPDRMDEEDIRELFGPEVYSKPLAAAMKEGYLADVDYHIVFDEAVKEAMNSGFDTRTLKSIKDLLRNESRNDEIALQIMEEIENIGLKGVKTILFCHNIEQANEMAELLDGKAYHSGIDKNARKNILSQFRKGDVNVICTRDMFNEGVDIPDARLLVFLRSTASKTIYEQQLGRGLRKHLGKPIVSVLDFVANIERLGHVKGLVDGIAAQNIKARSDGAGDQIQTGEIEIAREAGENAISGLQIRTEHTEFDFDKLSVALLEKIQSLRREYRDWSSLETMADVALLWSTLYGNTRPTYDLINDASAEGKFISASKVNSMGGLPKLQEELGFGVIHYSQIESIEDLASLWEDRFPGVKPTKALIKEASRAKEFVSFNIIGKHGGTAELQRALGYDVIDYSKLQGMDDVAELWSKNFPDTRPSRATIAAASKEGLFIAEPTLKNFGTLDELRALTGHTDPRKSIDSIKKAAELWATIFPDIVPTKQVIEEASKKGRFVSASYILKLGGIEKLKEELGYEAVKKPNIKDFESIDDLAELWNQNLPGIKPTKESVSKASKENLFVTLDAVKSLGGTMELARASGYTSHRQIRRRWTEINSADDLAKLWLEKADGLQPSVRNIGKIAAGGNYPSLPTVQKYGGIAGLKKALSKLG